MRFGQQMETFDAPKNGDHFGAILAVAKCCEEAGVDSLWFADHFMWRKETEPERMYPVLECFVTLAAIAAVTERVRIGSLVAGVPYRNPALLAKMCTTLDVISGGRSMVGLGAGWHRQEFDGYGWSFPTARERIEMLEDAVQIVKAMMTQRPATYSGKHYSIKDALNDPMPVQKPHPPILIGGSGERRMLRLVAEYADYCNVFGDPETVARKFDVLRRHCEEVNRPYHQITRSNYISILIARDENELTAKRKKHSRLLRSFEGVVGTPDAVIAGLKEYEAAGSQYIIYRLVDAHEIEPIRLLGDKVLPAFAIDIKEKTLRLE